jgi:hypothetical protein
MDIKKKIAVIAEPFGFGPVSKAFSIVKRLNSYNKYEFYFYGGSVADEFFKKEDIPIKEFNYSEQYDLAIIVLAPQFVSHFTSKKTPTFYFDSLGFLWNRPFIETFHHLNNLTAYFVQDVFNSYDNLYELLENKKILKRVGAIVDVEFNDKNNEHKKTVIQLGGLVNPVNKDAVKNYIQLIKPILEYFSKENTVILSSSEIKTYLNREFNIKTAKHTEAISYYTNADTIITSPGLTTLLELNQLNKPFIPLPPQNFSQLLILRNLEKCVAKEHRSLINYLLSYYPMSIFETEEDGISYVNQINNSLCFDNTFLNSYINLLKNAEVQANIISSFDGVNDCVSLILDYL